jgi:trans-aconitate 2-methyltransferase
MNWATQYAKQYTTFEDERTRPVRDLLNAIPLAQVRTAVDIGCGPGNSTEALIARFPEAQVSALDSSEDMLDTARKRLPGVRFELMGAQDWHPAEKVDLIFANASLQWVPDHATLYPRLISNLEAGGVLAVQTPDNLGEPAHQLMRKVADNGPWAERLVDVKRTPRNNANWYLELLRPLCKRVDVWRTTYYHALPGGAADVVAWFKGSGLRPYLAPLTEEEQQDYLARYEDAVRDAYPALSDGTVLLPFPRLFIVAIR